MMKGAERVLRSTEAGRSILSAADYAGMRTLLGVGSAKGFMVRKTSNQSIASGSFVVIAFQQVDFDDDEAFDTDTGVYTCPRSGCMCLVGRYGIDNTAVDGGRYNATIMKNGADVAYLGDQIAGGGGYCGVIGATLLMVQAEDALTLAAYTTNGFTAQGYAPATWFGGFYIK